MCDRGHFLNIDTLNRILFSQLTRFGKLSFFNFRPSFLSPDGFRSIGCIGCKLICLADVDSSELFYLIFIFYFECLVRSQP